MSDTLPPRDAQGHFISRNTPLENTVKTETQVSVPPSPPKNPLDEPLVSIQIQNPFKRLLYWFNDVRKKQTTTFDLKIKIPLIALPVFLVIVGGALQAVFSLGKSVEKKETAAIPTPTPVVIVKPTLVPKPIIISKLGTIKATYQVIGLVSETTPTLIPVSPAIVLNTSDISTPSPTLIPQTSTPTPTVAPYRYVLIQGSQITFLVIPSSISINFYLNKRVLVTGFFDQTKNTLQIEETSDIELMP